MLASILFFCLSLILDLEAPFIIFLEHLVFLCFRFTGKILFRVDVLYVCARKCMYVCAGVCDAMSVSNRSDISGLQVVDYGVNISLTNLSVTFHIDYQRGISCCLNPLSAFIPPFSEGK